MLPLHLPFISGKEKEYVAEVIDSGKLSGNGKFTMLCHSYFETKLGFKKVLLTNSCTDALEMCALILELEPGDEIIVPSYTFVTTANAFYNYGVIPVFCDSMKDDPNIDPLQMERKITSRTKAIVVMHYAGISCEMEQILAIAKKHSLYVIEDSALGLGSTYNKKPLGSLGDLATFSFHETKNITCGEGGLLVINNEKLIQKAEIIWEKGTNRAAYLRGEFNKYEWISKGSSFLTSEIHAAFLFGQLQNFNYIQLKRNEIWNTYQKAFEGFKKITLTNPGSNKQVNGSVFHFIFDEPANKESFIQFMNSHHITVSSHYRCLHSSNFGKSKFKCAKLINCEKIESTLIRFPIYVSLPFEQQQLIIKKTLDFLKAIE